MKNWAEALLAIVVIGLLGWSLTMVTGEGSPTPPGNGGTVGPPPTFDPDSAARGQLVAESEGCMACHSADGGPGTGPTFKGVAGASRPLTTGEFVTADDAYLRRSIVDPSSQIVDGFQDVMPGSFGDMLSEGDINDLVAYIKSLGS